MWLLGDKSGYNLNCIGNNVPNSRTRLEVFRMGKFNDVNQLCVRPIHGPMVGLMKIFAFYRKILASVVQGRATIRLGSITHFSYFFIYWRQTARWQCCVTYEAVEERSRSGKLIGRTAVVAGGRRFNVLTLGRLSWTERDRVVDVLDVRNEAGGRRYQRFQLTYTVFTSEIFQTEFTARSLDAQQPSQPLANDDAHLLTSYILPGPTGSCSSATSQ